MGVRAQDMGTRVKGHKGARHGCDGARQAQGCKE